MHHTTEKHSTEYDKSKSKYYKDKKGRYHKKGQAYINAHYDASSDSNQDEEDSDYTDTE